MGELLLHLLKYVVAALVLAMGLMASPSEATWLWRRPSLLLRSLLAMYVVVPGLAFLMAKGLPLSPAVKAALLARHFGVSSELPIAAVAWLVGKAFLLPVLAGMAIRAWVPDLADRFAPRLFQAAGVVLLVMALVLLVEQWRVLVSLPGAAFLAMVAFLALALVMGHVLGGPDPGERTVLGAACASRHVGIAALVAAACPGPAVTAIVAGYLVASVLVSVPYLRWQQRVMLPGD